MNQKKDFYWVGIDVANKTFDAAIHSLWEPISEIQLHKLPVETFPRTKAGIDMMIKWADCKGVSSGIAVMEATGKYSIEMAEMMLAANCMLKPAIVDPFKIKHFGESLRIRNKTDKLDAAVIARYGAERAPTLWEPKEPEYIELQELTRLRTLIVKEKVSAENHARDLKKGSAPYEFAIEVVEKLKDSIQKMDKAIKKHIKESPSLKKTEELLATIPGVGPVTIATVLGEIGDLTRFKRSRQLAAFAGLSPKIYKSGDSVYKKTRLSKTGSARLRQILYLAALAAINAKTNSLSEFYQQLVKRGKAKMVAIGAVMRKMLILMRALLINSNKYEENFGKTPKFPA